MTELPTMHEMIQRSPVFYEECVPMDEIVQVREAAELMDVLAPITEAELDKISIPSNSAPGPDGILVKEWAKALKCIKALFYNLIIAIAGFPKELLSSRMIFIPKKDKAEDPSEFRPITIVSAVLRHLHKILASKLMDFQVIAKGKGVLMMDVSRTLPL